MKSILLFFALLAIPGCLAKISVRPLGKVVRCPYTKETFLERVTLDGLEDYIDNNKMATVACIKQIEEDYEKALEVFVTNMTEVTDQFEKKYSKNGDSSQNYPFFVSKAIKDMGIDIKRYVGFLKTASGKGRIENVKHYDKTLKQIVEEGFDLYQRNLGHLENKAPNEKMKTDAKNMIHVGCSPGMRMLEGVEKEFKECMKDRLSESEGHDES